MSASCFTRVNLLVLVISVAHRPPRLDITLPLTLVHLYYEVEVASAKAKVVMFETAMTSKAQDAAMLLSQQQERDNARERYEARLREDQRVRDQGGSCRGRTAAFLELVKLNNSSSEPFSPTATAEGLMQMESTREVPTRVTAQTPNEPQPSARLLGAAQTPLTIMAAPPPLTPAEEMAKLSARLEKLNMMLHGFASMYASRFSHLSVEGGVGMETTDHTDDALAEILTNKSALVEKIEKANSRMHKLTMEMFSDEMNED